MRRLLSTTVVLNPEARLLAFCNDTFAPTPDEPAPGFLVIDFVAHGGDSMEGTFLWSWVATDLCSGATDAVALVAREQSLVVDGREVIRRQFPVPILGIDSNNDSDFINVTLLEYCKERQIEFTRSRPYKKNDQPGSSKRMSQ
jgi:hypothetical protein